MSFLICLYTTGRCQCFVLIFLRLKRKSLIGDSLELFLFFCCSFLYNFLLSLQTINCFIENFLVFDPNNFISGLLVVWDKKMVHTQFNWCWYHVPTFAPYKVEGMFLPLILEHGSSAQSAKTAAIVLQSLTPNAQSVFRVLAEYQLSHPDDEGK